MKPLSTHRPLTADRLAFLDVLRGLAASAVVLQHGLEASLPGYLAFSIRYFDLGQFGVTLFMLISGFIIPVTLERGRSNARFWINRLFRLFPLYWASICFFWLYYHAVAPERLYPAEGWQWLLNLTMLQEFLRVPHVNGVFWTLTLELVFYGCCSMLYLFGLSSRTSLVVWLGQTALIALGICCPLLSARRFPGGYAFLLLTMFVGTLFHRYVSGQVSRRELVVVLTALAPLSLAVSYVNFALFVRTGHALTFHGVWSVWLAAYVLFMAALAYRSCPMPFWLCYLGRISYSIYLVHAGFVLILPQDWPGPIYFCALLVGTFAVSSLTYRWIEKPCVELGRRLLAAPAADDSPSWPVIGAITRRRAA
jgi:peptidoglycan/LPS O-acetylase OafA/YrhL